MSNHAKRRAQERWQQPEVHSEIVIKLLRTGHVQVSGPLAKTDLCKEMLREAVRVVEGYKSEIEKKIVTPEDNVIIRPS